MTLNPGDNPPPAESTGLRCPHCDYDLTGLTEDRCPECGEAFDRELLRKIAANEPIPAVPWDTDLSPRGFFKTWWLAMTNRSGLAASFPPVYDVDRARGYSLSCHLISILLFVIPLTCIGRIGPTCGAAILFGFIIVLAFTLFEMTVAFGLSRLLKSKGIRQKYHYWRGLTHYMSGYTWLFTSWIACIFVIDYRMEPGYLRSCACLCGFGILVWWVLGFGAMAYKRGEKSLSILLACVWVLLVSLFATSPILIPVLSIPHIVH